jgi:hypothetical protein
VRRVVAVERHIDEQHVLRPDQVVAVTGADLVVVGHRQRTRRAGLDAQPAQDAAVVVDLVVDGVALTGRVALLGGVVLALHVDGVRRAGPRAQLAADALLEAVVVAVELVPAVEALLQLRGHLRVRHGLGLDEHRAQRDGEAAAEHGAREHEHSATATNTTVPTEASRLATVGFIG